MIRTDFKRSQTKIYANFFLYHFFFFFYILILSETAFAVIYQSVLIIMF